MALLDDFFSLTDDKLADTYAKPTFDAAKARKPILAAIDKANEQFGSTDPVRGRKAWSVNRNVVRFELPLTIKGKDAIHAPAERFTDALAKLRAAVEAGEIDSELEKLANGDASVKPRSASTGERKARAGWSPERRAKMEERAAAKRAGQGK